MEMISVDSSNVSKIGYSNGNIYVEFHNGALYCYYDVDVNIYNDFLNADSKGKFVHNVLKGTYRYERIQ